MSLTKWRQCELGEALTLQRGFDLPHRLRRAGDVPIVSSSGVSGVHDMAQVCGPGIVTGRYGTIGEVFYIRKSFWPLNTTLYVREFRGNEPLYLSYLLRTIDFASHSGKSGVPGVNRNDIHKLKVVLPPPPEQRAIAEALSDVDGLLAALESLIAKKRAVKQTAVQQLLTGEIRLPGFSGQWETKRLEEIADLHRQNVMPAAFGDTLFMHFSLPAFDEGQFPVTQPGFAIGSNKFRVPKNAVLVSKLNPRIPRVWAPTSVGDNAVASTEFLVLTATGEISHSFLYAVCVSSGFYEQMKSLATGTTGSHQRISPPDAMKIEVWLPTSKEEQHAITSILSDIDSEIDALERRRDKTRAIKQGMMQVLLTGRVRLVEPEPASEQEARSPRPTVKV